MCCHISWVDLHQRMSARQPFESEWFPAGPNRRPSISPTSPAAMAEPVSDLPRLPKQPWQPSSRTY